MMRLTMLSIRKKRQWLFTILMLACWPGNSMLFAQLAEDGPIKIKILTAGQMQNHNYRAEFGQGIGAGGQFNVRLTKNLDFTFKAGYDYMFMRQDSVVREWRWDYWRERYIDWLFMGALSPTQIDSFSMVLEYVRFDSSFIGYFNPRQNLGELRFSVGLEGHLPISNRMTLYSDFNFGFNRYRRSLKMVENWTKRFHWYYDSTGVANGLYTEDEIRKLDQFRHYMGADTNTYEFDYDLKVRVTHFAPAKVGNRFFVSPTVGLRIYLSPSVDLDLAYMGVFYLKRDLIESFEKLFNIPQRNYRWFPLDSKSMFLIGFTFKY